MSEELRRTPLDPWCAAKIGEPDNPLSTAALQDYQLTRLRETLQLVRTRSPFYRRHLADAPAELAALHDLQALPFTTAQELREDGLRFLCVSQDAIQRVVTLESSGTTGSPKRIYFTRADQELTVDFFHVGMSTFTAPGDRVLILLPGDTPGSVGDLLATALLRLGAQPIQHGLVRDVAATLAVMRREHVDVLVGVPTQVHALATYGRDVHLKHVLLTTDHVSPSIVRAVERAWGCTVYNHYGMTEMGLGGGVDCSARRGYHLREADMLFEIVDAVTGAPVADGAPGEVVFTTLTRTGMPLIRYRTGDISRFLPGACPCGTHLKTLAWVRQRAAGVVTVGAAVFTLADLDDALFAIPDVLNFSATVVRGSPDRLHLDIRTVEGSAAESEAAAQAVLAALESLKWARAGGRLELTVTMHATGYELPGTAKRAIAYSTA